MPESLDLQPPTDLTLQMSAAQNVLLRWQSPANGEGLDRTEVWGASVYDSAGPRLLGVVTHRAEFGEAGIRIFIHLRHEATPWVYQVRTEYPTGEKSAFIEIEG
jgi:hypothetical protein